MLCNSLPYPSNFISFNDRDSAVSGLRIKVPRAFPDFKPLTLTSLSSTLAITDIKEFLWLPVVLVGFEIWHRLQIIVKVRQQDYSHIIFKCEVQTDNDKTSTNGHFISLNLHISSSAQGTQQFKRYNILFL